MRIPAMRMRSKAIATITPHTIARRTTTARITMTIAMTNIAITATIMAIPMLMTANKPKAQPCRRRAERAAAISPDAVQPVEPLKGMDEAEAAALYRLMTWLSPAFPVGAFSYSSGIEWAVEAGDIADGSTLRDWLAAMLAEGSGFRHACQKVEDALATDIELPALVRRLEAELT